MLIHTGGAPERVDEPIVERAIRTSLDAFAFIDSLGLSATGELLIAGDEGPRGAIFIERGRVCWAAARGLSRRLSELLSQRASVPPPAMETMYRTCHSQGTPLGEHLVSRGVLSASDLRDALAQHTIESLNHLVATGDVYAAWSARSGKGYSPRFTFSTTELFVRGAASRQPALADEALLVLRALFADEGWAAAFVRTGEAAHPIPIALHGEGPAATSRLLRYGTWAASLLDVASAFSDPSPFVSIERPSHAIIAFRQSGLVCVGETGPMGPARLLNRRAQGRAKR